MLSGLFSTVVRQQNNDIQHEYNEYSTTAAVPYLLDIKRPCDSNTDQWLISQLTTEQLGLPEEAELSNCCLTALQREYYLVQCYWDNLTLYATYCYTESVLSIDTIPKA